MTTQKLGIGALEAREQMERQVDCIKNAMNSFMADAEKVTNKSAARRARKLSLEIGQQLKDYRAKSIK